MLIVTAAVLMGCAQPSGNDGDVINQGYTSGDGSVRQWPQDDRGEPVRLTGEDFEGGAVDTGDWQGDVVVINTWYAACPPCRAEAPALVAIAEEYQGRAHLVGLNSTDETATAQAFQRTFDVNYPSIADRDGAATATLQGVVPLQAVPTTVLLDQQGRVAARVLGEVPQSTLATLIDDLLDEAAPAATTSDAAADDSDLDGSAADSDTTSNDPTETTTDSSNTDEVQTQVDDQDAESAS